MLPLFFSIISSFSIIGISEIMEFSSILMLLFVSRFACAIYDDVLPHGHMARSEQSSVVLSGMKLNLLFGRQESCPAGECTSQSILRYRSS